MTEPEPAAAARGLKLSGRANPSAQTARKAQTAGKAQTAPPKQTAHRADTAQPGGAALPPGRRILGWTLAVAGLITYNWWLLVPLKPGLMTSPNELFSNLEVDGQPYATAMQHADLLSGILLLAAFAVLGRRSVAAGWRDWAAMLVFAAGGALGGVYSEVCADGISAVCRQQEIHFQLPVSQYLHMAAGIVEFAGITVALFLARRRTRGREDLAARLYRRLWAGALICYPLLGLAYLVDRMGGVMEAVFFSGFTIMVAVQVAERTRHPAADLLPPPAARTVL